MRLKARARYGTVSFLNLQKRDCTIRMELHPLGSNFLEFDWDIGGDHHGFYASSVMGGQFSYFLKAIYCLYSEIGDMHRCFGRDVSVWRNFPTEDDTLKQGETRINSEFDWDGEGSLVYFHFSRIQSESPEEYYLKEDKVSVEIRFRRLRKGPKYSYVVDGKDLCYAVAKAVTDVLKKHGIHGYYRSTGDSCDVSQGDNIDPEQFLFVKAYALGAVEARALTPLLAEDDDNYSEVSSFEKELELLLFDM